MKRWHQEKSITCRNWKKHKKIHIQSNLDKQKYPGQDPYQVDCVCDDQKGRFRKKDAYDCGKSKCQICHSYKFPKRLPTNKEIKSNWSFKEEKDCLNR